MPGKRSSAISDDKIDSDEPLWRLSRYLAKAREIHINVSVSPPSRYLAPRSQINRKTTDSFLPFRYIRPSSHANSDHRNRILYDIHGKDGILHTLPGQPQYDPGDFPYNIQFPIWLWQEFYEEIYNYSGNWILFCLLDNGLFAVYSANEYFSGFSCGCGDMRLYLSPDPGTLITLAMTDAQYELYAIMTRPVPVWTAWDQETIARRVAWAMVGHRRLGGRYAFWAAFNLWAEALSESPDVVGMIGGMVLAEVVSEGGSCWADEETID